MHDPERLEDLYYQMFELHKEKVPDMRIGQLLCNFFSWHMAEYRQDFFYVEDNELLFRFDIFIKRLIGAKEEQ